MIVCAPHLGLSPDSDLGGEVYERTLLTRLALHGDTIRLIVPPEADLAPIVPGWQVERWRRHRARRWWRSNAAAAGALAESYRIAAFDLLHVHSGLHFGRGALAVRQRLKAGFPIVVHHHHLEGNLIERSLEATACRGADAVVVPSRFAAQALAEARGPRGPRVAVIPRGVDLPADPGGGAALPGPGGRRLILSVGRLVPRKQPLLLVEAMAQVERLQPGLGRLRFIGEGPLDSALGARARALGIERWVELAGRCPESGKWRALRECDVFATASGLEGFGLAAAEAMAAGAAVVAPRAAAFPELIEDGRSGMLFAPGDARALAATLILLLRQPQRARELGEAAARRAAAEFSWDAAARRLRDLYRDEISRARRAA